MKAIVFRAPHDVRVETVPDPTLASANGAIVRVVRASICGSDLHPYHGVMAIPSGVVLGHECVGVIEEVGGYVRRFRKGNRVIVPAGRKRTPRSDHADQPSSSLERRTPR